MSKVIKQLGGSTSAAYTIDPTQIIIYGYDCEAPEGSNLVETDKSRLSIDKALVKNIAARGVKQPVQCRLVGDQIVVVNGRRRVLHARAANELRVEHGEEPLPIKFDLERGGDNPDARFTMVSANSFNRELGPLAQAEHARDMLNAGLAEEDVANAFGFSRATLGNRLRLLELPKGVQKHVRSGALSMMSALELACMEPAEAVEAAEELAKEGGPRKGQANRARAKKNGAETELPPARPKLGLLKKLLGTEEFAECSEDVQRVVRWVVGDLKTPNTIDGLAAAVKAAEGRKKAPPRVEE